MRTGSNKALSKEALEFIHTTFKLKDGELYRHWRKLKWVQVEMKDNTGLGYCSVNVMRTALRAHRLVWILEHNGDVPEGWDIHHKDGNKLNNSVSNLEICTHVEHTVNHNKKGSKGYYKHGNGWRVQKRVKGIIVFSMQCATETEAEQVSKEYDSINN